MDYVLASLMSPSYASAMTRQLWQFATSTMVFLLILGPFSAIPSEAQVLAVNRVDVAPATNLALEMTVLGLPSSGLQDAGLFFPEFEPGTSGSAMGFAIVLPDDEAKQLVSNPRAILIHKLNQPVRVGPTKFRIGARTPLPPDDAPEARSYYEVALALEVSANGGLNRGIGLSTSSVVQIRRGPAPNGGLEPLLLETRPIMHDLQFQEGKSILLGGFFNPADAARLPDLPPMPESPLLNYVLSKAPRHSEDNEIVVLLTPRRVGGSGEPIPAPVIANPAITAVPLPPVSESPVEKFVIPAVASVPAIVDPNPVLASLTMPGAVVAPPPSAAGPRPKLKLELRPDLRPDPKPEPKLEAPYYTVQAGAFRSRAKAEALAARLGEKFEKVFLEEVPTLATPYRVRVGRLQTVRSARQVQASLADEGFETFIVRPDSR